MAKFGIFIVGQFKGYSETQKDNFTNRIIGVVTATYENKFDDVQENIIEISVTEEQAKEHSKSWETIIGRPVSVQVGQKVRSGTSKRTGKDYAFLNTYLFKDAKVEVITPSK